MFKTHIQDRYTDADHELAYILESINVIEEKVSNDMRLIDQEHDKNIKNNLDDWEIQLYFYDQNEADFFHYESISKTIIESLFVRQVALVERFLVKVAFDVFNHTIGENRLIIPPNYKKTQDPSRFSDCLAAVDSIKNNTSLNLKTISGWKVFVKSRNIRHKLAHGETRFPLTHDDAENYNSIFDESLLVYSAPFMVENKDELIRSPDKDYYGISSSYSPIIELNTFFSEFITAVKDILCRDVA